ncbi:pectinesterase family protein [Sphingomonas sp. RS2018]
MILRLTALALALSSTAATTAQAADERYRVRADCGAQPRCFATIGAALSAAERNAAGWVTIDVGAGDYREKLTVRRRRTRLTGQGPERTRLHFDAVAETAGRYDRAGWGTAGSATLTIAASDVAVSGMTIANDYDYLSNDALPAGDARRIGNSQGVAVTIDTDSDRVVFDSVALLGYQDTLFTRGRRAVIRNSVIAGNVDFIFGNGMLLIEDSELRTRRRSAPTAPGEFASFIAAPSTPLSQPIGIVVYRSRLTREAGVADGSIALARPWHPTTTFADGRYADPKAVGHALFIDCTMDAHIHPDGWTSMNGTARDGTKTAVFRPQDARFAERGSRGPGARRRDIGMPRIAVPGIAAIRAAFAAVEPKP